MRVVVAPDKFKGSLTAVDVAAHVSIGLRSVVMDLEVDQTPVADGGDGTVDAAVAAGFDRITVDATGPTGARVESSYARRGDEAVIEMASVCGLLLLPGGELHPETSSSYGLGEVVLAAVRDGARRIVLGIGGSASTDGGAGFLQGLGVRVSTRDGKPVAAGGGTLADVASLELDSVPSVFADVTLIVASDVDNPLTGPRGAASVYGPQKGASRTQVDHLDAALVRWARVVAAATGVDRSLTPGAGAAGGVGFAAVAVLGAELRPGIDLILDLVGLRDQLRGADLVVTGEGSLDAQSLAGKAPVGVAEAARSAAVPVVAVCGRNLLSRPELSAAGIDAVYALTDLEADVTRCMTDAGPLLERVGSLIARSRLSAARA